MFQIPGLPVYSSVGGGNRQTSPARKYNRHPSPFNEDEGESYDASTDTKSLLTNHWINVHANSFQPIVREKLTPPAEDTSNPLVYVQATNQPIVPTYTTFVDNREIVKPATATVMDTRRAGMLDEEDEEVAAIDKDKKDDDDAAAAAASDNEVDSILAKRDERLEQRYDQRRKYKQQRSRSRMSVVCGGRKTPAGVVRTAKRRRLNNGGVAQTTGSADESATKVQTVSKETKNKNKSSVLSNIIKYAKYPVYVSSNIMSIYLMLSYMGVDMSQYTNLTLVSTSLLKHINSAVASGGVVADVFGRLTPGMLVNTTERLAAPFATTLTLLK